MLGTIFAQGSSSGSSAGPSSMALNASGYIKRRKNFFSFVRSGKNLSILSEPAEIFFSHIVELL